jgi:hypothetical protein
MRYPSVTAASYAGVDRHASTLHLCVLDSSGTVRLSRELKARPLTADQYGEAKDRRRRAAV